MSQSAIPEFTGDTTLIQGILREILVEELFVDVPVAQIGEHDGLRNTLGLDSLGFIELRAQCERIFKVTICDEDFSPTNFSTIATVTALIARLLD